MISPQNNLYLKVQKVKASKFLLACVPSVSVWIRSKERPKHEKQDFCAVFDTHSFIHTYIHTYSFFEQNAFRRALDIHTQTLFNFKFKVAKDKLVSSSYRYDFKTTKTRNYNILIFKLLKRVILQNVALEIRKVRSSKRRNLEESSIVLRPYTKRSVDHKKLFVQTVETKYNYRVGYRMQTGD